MTAVDGLPFAVFCTSIDLLALISRGFRNLPKSPNSIQKIVTGYSKTIQETVISEFKVLKSQGCRLSLTFDECTSLRKRRYLNLNVHSKGLFWNLGLVRVHGSLPAEKCVQTKLNDFGLSLDQDIVCITTDGASVMKKIGKIIKQIKVMTIQIFGPNNYMIS